MGELFRATRPQGHWLSSLNYKELGVLSKMEFNYIVTASQNVIFVLSGVRELVVSCEILLQKVHTSGNVADVFDKYSY